ncbi:MAG: nitroreductase family protein [Bacteroidota bacterium]
MDIIEALNWRYASKKMNGQKVPAEKIERILEAIRLAPSANGIQPYTVLVVEDRELLDKIQPIANNQVQITQCSALLIFAAWKTTLPEQVQEFISHMASERNVEESTYDFMKERLLAGAANQPAEAQFNHNARQAFIALGTALVAAAAEKVDATPMGGFKANDLDELLGLKEKNLGSVAIMPLGYRDEANDFLLKQKKVRRHSDKMFIRL